MDSYRTRDRSALTAREWEVARLVALGKRDDEIAAELAIRPTTVHNHIVRIYQKAGVHRRADLAWWFQQRIMYDDAFSEADSAP